MMPGQRSEKVRVGLCKVCHKLMKTLGSGTGAKQDAFLLSTFVSRVDLDEGSRLDGLTAPLPVVAGCVFAHHRHNQRTYLSPLGLCLPLFQHEPLRRWRRRGKIKLKKVFAFLSRLPFAFPATYVIEFASVTRFASAQRARCRAAKTHKAR